MSEIKVDLGDRSYSIYFERGEGLNAINQFENIVTGQNVFDTLKKKLLLDQRDVTIIPAGEQSKTLKTYDELTTKLQDAEEITALGGGVVTDLAGYAASTIKRGIPLINIPTSLVGMVDAAIGGKNGVNKGDRKNYLGTFYQPELVIVDPLLLETLPEKEFRNGVAEIIKYGAISKGNLLERCAYQIAGSADLDEIMLECIKIKVELVEKDERDKAQRKALNFGHTIGHALELSLGLSHGEAISIGMTYEAELACRLNIYSDTNCLMIRNALEANYLPTKLPLGADVEKTIELMQLDKKGRLVFAFNEHNYFLKIHEKEVREVLNEA